MPCIIDDFKKYVQETFKGSQDINTVINGLVELKSTAQKANPIEIISWKKDMTPTEEKYSALSNFNTGPVYTRGHWFPNVEAAFHYEKALMFKDTDAQAKLKELKPGWNTYKVQGQEKKHTAGMAALNIGRSIKGFVPEAWDKVSEQVLRNVMARYYNNSTEGKALLLSTGDKVFSHTVKDEKYAKLFPQILMDIRDNLRKQNNEVIFTTDDVVKSLEEAYKLERQSALRHLPKELAKARVATSVIGQGVKNSSANTIVGVYDKYNLANLDNYSSTDVVYLTANGNRTGSIKPVVAGKLQGNYKLIDKAIDAGASFVADTKEHLDKTGGYNTGEVALAEYLSSHGYKREDKGLYGLWTKKNAIRDRNNQADEDSAAIQC